MVGGVEIGISFSGDLSQGQEHKLWEVASKSPIHRMLTATVPVQNETTTGSGSAPKNDQLPTRASLSIRGAKPQNVQVLVEATALAT
jgi:hypothetical protein